MFLNCSTVRLLSIRYKPEFFVLFIMLFAATVIHAQPSTAHLAQVDTIRSRMLNSILAEARSSLTVAEQLYDSMQFTVTTDRVFSSRDYDSTKLYWNYDFRNVNDFILVLAADWYKNKSAPSAQNLTNRDKALAAMQWIANRGAWRVGGATTLAHFYVSPQSGDTLPRNFASYIYRVTKIQKAAMLLKDDLAPRARDKVEAMLKYDILFDELTKEKADAYRFFYNTDHIHNASSALLGFILYWLDSDSLTVEHLFDIKQYFESFLVPSPAWEDGLKPDGLGFHHGIHYNAYMYAFSTLCDQLYLLRQTDFQINESHYLFFRDALYAIALMSNETDELGSLGGRHPIFVKLPISGSAYWKTAYFGGAILGSGIDTLIAGIYNRLWGDSDQIPGVQPETFPSGFWQFNYGSLGIYRWRDKQMPLAGWLAGINGFNWSMKGGEIAPFSPPHNFFGRYQNYGTVEILYPGGRINSGARLDGWNWNYWPATTAIVLPWERLRAGPTDCVWGLNETTNSKFAGALRFQPRSNGLLGVEGNMGMYSMDFRQKMLGRYRCHSSFIDYHDTTFTFKKSVFAIDGKLIILGSGINNNDSDYPTVTTLFQGHLIDQNDPVVINGVFQTSFPFETEINNGAGSWFIDAHGSGYLVCSTGKVLVVKSEQTTPLRRNNGTFTTGDFARAWIDHGTAPQNASYEYILVPAATAGEMERLKNNMHSADSALYRVVKQDSFAHIISYPDRHITAYAFFRQQSSITHGPVKSVSDPVMIMTQETDGGLDLTLVNPNLGYEYNKEYPAITQKRIEIRITGQWNIMDSSENVILVSAGTSESVLSFLTDHGLPLDLKLTHPEAVNR